jgi:hypothetical protein
MWHPCSPWWPATSSSIARSLGSGFDFLTFEEFSRTWRVEPEC